MFDSFEQDILKAVSGRFSFLNGVTLATDPHYDWEDPRATEKHELMHQELVDLSVFGWFQRLVLNLYQADEVPQEHKAIYGRVFSETMRGSFKVQEGLASYRTLTWYRAYTDSAGNYLRSLPPLYREALGLFEPLLPEYAHVGVQDQAGIHAVCNALGVYFMNAPLPVYYQDWSRLSRAELQYINVDSPDDRLRQMGRHAKEPSRIIAESLRFITAAILENGGVPEDYWAWFDETLASLQTASAAKATCGFFERGPLCAAMLRRWRQDIDYDYSKYLFNDDIEARLAKPRDISSERLEATRFHSLNIGNALDEYKDSNLPNIKAYLKKILEINAADNAALVITTANPTDAPIRIGTQADVPPDSMCGVLLEVNKSLLRRFEASVVNRETFTFAFSLSHLRQAHQLVPEHNVIRFIHVFFHNLLAQKNLLDSAFYIVRITEHHWFQKTFDVNQFERFGFSVHGNKRAFCYFRDRSLYFYAVATGQEMSIRKVLGGRSADSGQFDSYLVDDIGLTLGQLAVLGFFGGAL